jgi:hypothetical protein
MPTIHEQIDELLAADLHGELSSSERDTFHAHLVECAECRQIFQEQKTMDKLLNNTLAANKADPAFEQRMVARFRSRVPRRFGLVQLVVNLVRLRAVQLTAVAALLLSMVQVGRWLTKEPFVVGNEELLSPQASSVAELRDKLAAKSEPKDRRNSVSAAAKGDAPGQERDEFASSSSAGGTRAAKPAPPPAETETALPVTVYSADVLNKEGATASETSEQIAPGPLANRKLIRNATADLEIVSFEDAVQKITGFAAEEKGYLATSSSQKQANGKLSGRVVVKVLPDNLDRFLGKLRGIGELKNQAITTEDVTKQYFDTESRLKNARTMEQRLIEILKTKSKDVADLLAVEKELGRVREEIEEMQGELKFMDSQVQFATVTIQLSEKNMNVPAAFLLKERAQLALFAPEVEKTYNEIKALASPKVQITNAQINRDNTGRISAFVYMLIAPEESDQIISRVKVMARVENFQVQTERVAQGGNDGLGENAKTERDKVALNVTISREAQEQALQQTSLRIRSSDVNERTKELRTLAEKQGGRIRSSSFSRDPNGREYADVSLRVPIKNYNALVQSLNSLGKLENVTIHRDDRPDVQIDQANAPADLTIQVYSPGNLVSQETGIIATLRRTIAQGAGALMWSARMIGVAVAFFAPWVVALVGLWFVLRRISRARHKRKQRGEEESRLT